MSIHFDIHTHTHTIWPNGSISLIFLSHRVYFYHLQPILPPLVTHSDQPVQLLQLHYASLRERDGRVTLPQVIFNQIRKYLFIHIPFIQIFLTTFIVSYAIHTEDERERERASENFTNSNPSDLQLLGILQLTQQPSRKIHMAICTLNNYTHTTSLSLSSPN